MFGATCTVGKKVIEFVWGFCAPAQYKNLLFPAGSEGADQIIVASQRFQAFELEYIQNRGKWIIWFDFS